jgi:hypothetical protein
MGLPIQYENIIRVSANANTLRFLVASVATEVHQQHPLFFGRQVTANDIRPTPEHVHFGN